jgi:hypothetical protein
MKKALFIVVISLTITSLYAQRSIDALFEKYAGKEGFVTVTISGDLLKFAACLDDDDNDNSIPAHVTEIRILAQEDDNLQVDNFYDLVMKGIKVGDYEEFMSVKKTHQNLKMYVRAEGNKFREFLLIAGGEDNAVVQIKGEMTFKEAKKFSEDAKKNHGLNIVATHSKN